jgi:membrane protease YdiL (CAAX protease family)
VVLLTPLFFGAAHLHHLRERVVHEGVPLSSALAMVGGWRRPCMQRGPSCAAPACWSPPGRPGACMRSTVLVHPPSPPATSCRWRRVLHHHTHTHCPSPQALFQFAYTTVFGWYATHLFLATRHLLAPVLAHAFCNALGFPPFEEMLRHRQKGLLAALLLAGIGGFSWLLGPLTQPALYAA